MSNRESLRRLSKRFPKPDELDNIINGLRKEDDRTVAIVGASLVESVLERVLISAFPNKSSDLLPRLFENRGPLSDFNGKILIADAIWVAGVKTEELHRVRHIRNCFAHARIPVTFDTPEIAKEVQGFAALAALRKVSLEMSEQGRFADMPNKAAYLFNCHILMLKMEDTHVKLGGKPLIPRE